MKTIEIDSTFPEAHYQLGLTYLKCDNSIDAESHLLKAIKHGKILLNHLQKKEKILIEKSQFQYAKLLFIKIQKSKKMYSLFYYELALLYLTKKKKSKAKKLFFNSIELNPNHSQAYRDLGILLIEKPDSLFLTDF